MQRFDRGAHQRRALLHRFENGKNPVPGASAAFCASCSAARPAVLRDSRLDTATAVRNTAPLASSTQKMMRVVTLRKPPGARRGELVIRSVYSLWSSPDRWRVVTNANVTVAYRIPAAIRVRTITRFESRSQDERGQMVGRRSPCSWRAKTAGAETPCGSSRIESPRRE